MILHSTPQCTLSDVLCIQEESHISQFLMNFHPEFESIQAAHMNQETAPNLDICVQELMLQSQSSVNQDSPS